MLWRGGNEGRLVKVNLFTRTSLGEVNFYLLNDHITYSDNVRTTPEQHIFPKAKGHFLMLPRAILRLFLLCRSLHLIHFGENVTYHTTLLFAVRFTV